VSFDNRTADRKSHTHPVGLGGVERVEHALKLQGERGLPNTGNPDDWAKIAGRKGERIVTVKSLVGHTRQPQRNMEKVITTGQ